MKADVLLDQVVVSENGSSRKECSGLVLIRLMPPAGDAQAMYPAGRPVALRDGMAKKFKGYQEQLDSRTDVTGTSWIEVQVVSMTDFRLMGKLMAELIGLLKKNWPLPIGFGLLDAVSDDIKKGAPQVIAVGKSDTFKANALPLKLTIDLQAPHDVYGDFGSPRDPVHGLPIEGPAVREVLFKKGSPNGKVVLSVEAV